MMHYLLIVSLSVPELKGPGEFSPELFPPTLQNLKRLLKEIIKCNQGIYSLLQISKVINRMGLLLKDQEMEVRDSEVSEGKT